MANNGVSRSRTFLAIGVAGFIAAAASASEALFPSPLHLTRRITDPLSSVASFIVEEYCSGNRVVTIHGDRTVIVDYKSQQLTEIDRAAGTYSVTRFDAIARGGSRTQRQALETTSEQRRAVPLGQRPSARGTAVETFEVMADGASGKRLVGFDTSVFVSRAAFDVLMGASYPNDPGREHAALLSVAARPARRIRSEATTAAADDAEYALPVEQAFEFDAGGQIVVTSNVVLRVGNELPALELLAIPPGSKQVESRLSAVPRVLDELDRLPRRPGP